MWFQSILLLLGSTLALSKESGPSDFLGFKESIIGGDVASSGQFPFEVFFRYTSKRNGKLYQCGGTLLSPNFFLTAAHCAINMKAGHGSVMVGSTTLGRDPSAQWSPVKRAIVHPEYLVGDHAFANDIAVLEINGVSLTDKVQLVKIARNDAPLLSSPLATASGFGTYAVNAKGFVSSEHLRHVKVKLFSFAQCQRLKRFFAKTQICAGDYQKGTGPGDSGGPLLVESGSGMVQVGLTSHGPSDEYTMFNHQDRDPAVYTRVAQYCAWIEANTNNQFRCT
ncbi:hypothetical protein QR680_013558 [Steinernema hermaphroditum]|uniref:Peptidase S1 domain-containing protein n=1 Tax=Steinernema hermaphroditum TaxID=289476 RepID=A0AA39M2H7_9BILA|nr:hypothetical protein QR680_013558 [Steinernema hermaphroditum]